MWARAVKAAVMARIFCFLLTLTLTLTLALLGRAQARAAFQSPPQMVATSRAIAIVCIEKTEKVAARGAQRNYRQRASARVERVFKGQLPTEIALYGDEDFICAQCHFAPGRALVFLQRNGALWAGNNWHLSARPIVNDQIEWFGESGGAFDLKMQPLDAVLKQLRATLETQARAPRFTLSFQVAKVPSWRVYNYETKESRDFERAQLEAWIKSLPLGSNLQHDFDDVGRNPDAATLKQLETLCYLAGVTWDMLPGV